MHYHIVQESEFDEHGQCSMTITAKDDRSKHEWTLVGDPRERNAYYQRCGCTVSFERSAKLPGASICLRVQLLAAMDGEDDESVG